MARKIEADIEVGKFLGWKNEVDKSCAYSLTDPPLDE